MPTTEHIPALADVLKHAKPYADALSTLESRVQELTDEQQSLTRRHLPGIRFALAKLADARALLAAALNAAAAHFAAPNERTVSIHGLKLGFRKNVGRIAYDEPELVIDRIRRVMPARLDELAPSVRILDKKALGNLTAAELKKIGCEIAGAGDELVIKSATADVEKLVERMIKDDETAAAQKGRAS